MICSSGSSAMMETSWETSRLDSSQQAPAMAETSNVRCALGGA